MFDFIFHLTLSKLALMSAIIFVGSYWIGAIFLRPILRLFINRSNRSDVNSIIGGVLSAFGVLFGILLGLIAVASYQNLSDVEAHVNSEASVMLALYRDVSDFPSPVNKQLQSQLQDYNRFIIEKEWSIQQQGNVPLGAWKKISMIRSSILDFEPQTNRDKLVQTEALKHLETLTEHGRYRRYAAIASIPSVMWYVMIVGTLINFGMLWLFNMKLTTHFLLGGMFAFFLGALILMIAVLERPYRSSELGIKHTPYKLVSQVMQQDQNISSIKTIQRKQ